MSYGTTASLICPACGQAFLTMQHSMEGMAQCPHCAHSALRSHFGTQSQVVGVMPVRRRIAHAPQAQEIPPPQVQPPLALEPQPVVRQAPLAHAPPAFIARGALQHGQALMPVGEPPPPHDYSNSSAHSPSSSRNAILIMAVVVAAGGVAMWLWSNQSPPAAVAANTLPISPVPAVVQEVRKAQVIIPTAPPRPPVVMPDTAAFAADAKTLVTDFFAATTPEARAACVHDGEKHSAEIEALFGPGAAEKIELRQLAQIPSVPFTLSTGQPSLLFKLATSRCPNGALMRLEAGADGKRRIFWPLLVETHQAQLSAFLNQEATGPAWFYVAMRPSHGLDLPAAQRSKYLTFDTQVSAANDAHFVACVERDSPLGRFMERESDWGKVYLARLLVRPLKMESDARCVIIVDCEGALER